MILSGFDLEVRLDTGGAGKASCPLATTVTLSRRTLWQNVSNSEAFYRRQGSLAMHYSSKLIQLYSSDDGVCHSEIVLIYTLSIT